MLDLIDLTITCQTCFPLYKCQDLLWHSIGAPKIDRGGYGLLLAALPCSSAQASQASPLSIVPHSLFFDLIYATLHATARPRVNLESLSLHGFANVLSCIQAKAVLLSLIWFMTPCPRSSFPTCIVFMCLLLFPPGGAAAPVSIPPLASLTCDLSCFSAFRLFLSIGSKSHNLTGQPVQCKGALQPF